MNKTKSCTKANKSFLSKTALILIIFASFVNSKIHIWEPKSLKSMYTGHEIPYSVMNFGQVPYGYSIYGTVFKASPIDACSELAPLKWDKNFGTLILLVERGNCNFSDKVFNSQKIGAGLVLIADNNVENVHKIFPVERTKELLDRIHIPSVLISKEDGDNFKAAIDAPNGNRPHEGSSSGLVELAIHFDLIKIHSQANVRIILQVDDYRSYDLINDFLTVLPRFKDIINLKIHFKIFQNANVPFQSDDCVKVGDDTFCVSKSLGNDKPDLALINETVKQLCLKNHDLTLFSDYSKKVREDCFDTDRQVIKGFKSCVEKIWADKITKDQQRLMSNCITLDSSENKIALMNNHEDIKYFLINYSPLIFINGYYYKGNFDDITHLFEALCNGFEVSPQVCYGLDSFSKSEDTNSASLARFVMMTFFVCAVLVTIAIALFYIIYKKKMKKRFTFVLQDEINKALAIYYSDKEEQLDGEQNKQESKDLPDASSAPSQPEG